VNVGGSSVVSIGQGSNLRVGGPSVTQIGGAVRCEVGGAASYSTVGDESRVTGGKLDVRMGNDALYTFGTAAKTVVGHPDREASVSTFVYGTADVSTTKTLTIESDTSIVLKCGDTQVIISPDGVTMKGKSLELDAGSKLAVASPSATLTLDDNFTAVGTKLTVSSSGAQLALDSNASLTGSKVQLGSGSGSSASASAQSNKGDDKKKPVFIRLKMLRNGKPAAGVAYKLVADGTLTLSGSTTGEGLVEQQVPGTVASVEVTLLDTGETHAFTVGSIDPVDTVLGAQQRLRRLGLYMGALDGTSGPLFQHALMVFQKMKGLSVNGEFDGATQSALKTAYGS
jgi:hypothetical protein